MALPKGTVSSLGTAGAACFFYSRKVVVSATTACCVPEGRCGGSDIIHA